MRENRDCLSVRRNERVGAPLAIPGGGRDTGRAMSQENVELVRQAMEALLRRDRDAWFAIHDEDYELVPIRDWPETGVRGREPAWNLNMRILDSFEWAPIEVERVDAGADKVLVHPQYEARGASSGAEVELDYWLVATVRQGRILRTQWFVDRDEALEAARLRE
jgi:ketosteroid isomerase-like protein